MVQLSGKYCSFGEALNPSVFRMSLFGLLMDGGTKKAPLPKVCLTYPAMMKIGTVIPYLKEI